jgi:hypothetical protein
MSKWNKTDNDIWKNSEVMTEFEKILLKAMFKIENEIKESNQLKTSQQDITKKLDNINKSVKSTSDSMNKFIDSAKNLAKDKKKDDAEVDEPDEVSYEPTPEEQKIAKENLLAELNQLASKAADERNYKLAYKIERTIDVIKYED